ncbi:MAG: patatin-like phospholipase family protein [bacterium]|nr:patatin-like phospholipase family protein [bacterium]
MGLFTKSKTALVLGGGGARGFCHIGVIEVLEENNLIPDIIIGTSMGALIGALYALYKDSRKVKDVVKEFIDDPELKDIEETFRKDIEEENALEKIRDGLKGVRNFLATSRLGLDKVSFFQKDFLKEKFEKDFGDKKFEDLKMKFYSVTTRLDNSSLVAFSQGPLLKPVIASATIPAVFKPVEIDGGLYVDGGVISNIASDIAFYAGADNIFSVSASSSRCKNQFRNGYELLEFTMYLRAKEMERYKENFSDFLLEPDIDMYNWFDFSNFEKIVNLGRARALSHLNELKGVFKGRNNKSGIRKSFYKTFRAKIEMK